jgi:uncharacterized protein YbjT (DUF2867 family)
MILVTGATGLNGKELLRVLSASGVALRALVRNPAKAEAIAALPHVEIVQGDMAHPETLAAGLRGVDRAMLISSSDPMMLDVQTNFIDAARKAGVKHIVKLSGIMPELDSAFRFARMHGEIEKRLEASGMAFTHLRAGEFMPAYFRQVPNITAKGAMFLPMEDARIASIDVGDIAAIAARVLTGSGHEGKTYPLHRPGGADHDGGRREALRRYRQDHPLCQCAAGGCAKGPACRRNAALSRRCAVRTVRRAPQRQGGEGLARRRSAARATPYFV